MYKGPFKWWVQSVMPVVFDDSLSYYEVLAKLTKYIEGLTGDVQEIEKVLETIEGIEDVTEFTKFLETIQSEIGNLNNLQTTDKTTLVNAINEIALKANNAYIKPSGGIPESDLSDEVKNKLNRTVDQNSYIINNRTLKKAPNNNTPADLGLGTYSVPEGGIPWDTLSADVKERIESGGGGTGGTKDYTELINKPQINGHTLNAGNNTSESLDLGTYNKPSTGIPESDLSAEVQEKLNTSGSIANSETSFVATRDYEASELIYINGVLYKTKYKILSGTNLIPGNNIETTDISSEIEKINSDIEALQSGSGPDSWTLGTNIQNVSSGSAVRFFEYFNCIGNESYLFIITPVHPFNNGAYYVYIKKRDGSQVDRQRFDAGGNEAQHRFTFVPTDTGEYYCEFESLSDSGICDYRIEIEYTESQGISELWAQVNNANQLKPRVGALETLVGEQQAQLNDLTDIPERVDAVEDDVDALEDDANNLRSAIDQSSESIINLFNPQTITKGVYMDSAGSMGVNADYYLSDFIEVEPTKDYFITNTGSNLGYAYDVNKKPYYKLPPTSIISGVGSIFRPNATTHYIKVNVYAGTGSASISVQPDKFMVIKGTTPPTKYYPHRANSVYKADHTGQVMQDLIETVNLFDQSDATIGYYYEDGEAHEMSRYYHSAIIPVTEGQTYAVSSTLATLGCYFNGQTYVSNILKSASTQPNGRPFSVFTVPTGVDGVIVNGYLEEGNGSPSITVRPEAFMLIEGNAVPSTYIPHTHTRKDYENEQYTRFDGNILKGKTLLTFGDSMTDARNHEAIEISNNGYMLNYAGYTAERNNMRYYNKGWSGGTIAYKTKPMIGSNGRILINLNDVLYTPDYITIFYGFNDYNQGGISLGDADSTDPTTFIGAWYCAFTALRTLYPEAKIGVIVSWGMSSEWHQAVINVCQRYGIEYLDTCDGNFPLIRKNGTSLLDDTYATAQQALTTYDGTHPNAFGYRRMASAYEAFLRRL